MFESFFEKRGQSNGQKAPAKRQLYDAVSASDVELVRKLLREDASIDLGDILGSDSVWNLASEKGNQMIIRLLIEKFPRLINQYNSSGHTLLYNAIDSNNIEFASFLLDKGADIDLDKSNWKLALEKNNLEIIALLIEYGAKLNDNILSELKANESSKKLLDKYRYDEVNPNSISKLTDKAEIYKKINMYLVPYDVDEKKCEALKKFIAFSYRTNNTDLCKVLNEKLENLGSSSQKSSISNYFSKPFINKVKIVDGVNEERREKIEKSMFDL
jgi:ankyrin repeat protein